MNYWDFPGGPVVKTLRFHCRGPGVGSLVRALRSHMLRGTDKKIKNKNKINKIKTQKNKEMNY